MTMAAFRFRLRIKLPEASFIDTNDPSVVLTLPQAALRVVLESRPPGSLRDSATIDATSEGLPLLGGCHLLRKKD